MSTYEDYDRTSVHYDETREPVGIEILLGCFARAGKPLSEVAILDAGCGTGSYSLEMARYVGRVEGIDLSDGMLREARRKAGKAQTRTTLRFQCASLDRLPFANDSFDGVMVNQVLHHLDDDVGTFGQHKEALCGLARVLRPGGVLVINICSTEQLHGGWWYRELFASAFDRLARRHIPVPRLSDLLDECGFVHRGSVVPVDAVFQGDSYFDSTGPLRKDWRDGDSVFALATEEELESACSRIVRMREQGTLDTYVAARDASRRSIGQVTFVHTVRRGESPEE